MIFFIATAVPEVAALTGSLGRGRAALDTDPLGSLSSTTRRIDPGDPSTCAAEKLVERANGMGETTLPRPPEDDAAAGVKGVDAFGIRRVRGMFPPAGDMTERADVSDTDSFNDDACGPEAAKGEDSGVALFEMALTPEAPLGAPPLVPKTPE